MPLILGPNTFALDAVRILLARGRPAAALEVFKMIDPENMNSAYLYSLLHFAVLGGLVSCPRIIIIIIIIIISLHIYIVTLFVDSVNVLLECWTYIICLSTVFQVQFYLDECLCNIQKIV
ncbi:unnamed protein product [Schistosoma mattheei]|uniref:Uncharacterized protein n=1 Tax=Schistosoma mattheei TaxID=31246 RepID=A0A183NR55_9TREM|nr:unnamed protein product [Schistosoma mattheei]